MMDGPEPGSHTGDEGRDERNGEGGHRKWKYMLDEKGGRKRAKQNKQTEKNRGMKGKAYQ